MIRIRKFRFKRRVTIFLRFFLFKRTRSYTRLGRVNQERPKSSSVFKFLSHLKSKAKTLCFRNNHDRIRGKVNEPLINKCHVAVPKGKTAVYVWSGEGGDFCRVLVPVINLNHPLFGELLREAEAEFGFNHPGGITIPCQIAEFEKVQTKIAAGWSNRKLMTWR